MDRFFVLFITILFQALIAGLIFIGFLLDPKLGLWIVAIYFFVITTFLTYFFFSRVSIGKFSSCLSLK
ncbi:hypothetical protein ELY11_02985 [Legionella septentrionalis]|uniref:Uncharacterized protein n=1 Tax=Legionella septentrionalis TaxID=2498109 RepID=A0A3S1CLU0_9GAMM|nr:hypothetical protein EKM59_04280 [Legionella septentrionalis]RUR00327.1 hypothetical protein ELY11_02985 [Legionella septentrionalis]RUR11816.1 hypothetical protein ELY14_00810 [Legionella septentrionalis]